MTLDADTTDAIVNQAHAFVATLWARFTPRQALNVLVLALAIVDEATADDGGATTADTRREALHAALEHSRTGVREWIARGMLGVTTATPDEDLLIVLRAYLELHRFAADTPLDAGPAAWLHTQQPARVWDLARLHGLVDP